MQTQPAFALPRCQRLVDGRRHPVPGSIPGAGQAAPETTLISFRQRLPEPLGVRTQAVDDGAPITAAARDEIELAAQLHQEAPQRAFRPVHRMAAETNSVHRRPLART